MTVNIDNKQQDLSTRIQNLVNEIIERAEDGIDQYEPTCLQTVRCDGNDNEIFIDVDITFNVQAYYEDGYLNTDITVNSVFVYEAVLLHDDETKQEIPNSDMDWRTKLVY